MTAIAVFDTRLGTQAQEASRVGTWTWDVRTDDLFLSAELARIYGLPSHHGPFAFDAYLSQVHPRDRERVAQAVQAARTSRSSFEYDHAVLRPDGVSRVYHTRGSVVCDTAGEVTQIIGMAMDVTDRVADQERLRESEQLFRSLFEQSAVGLAIADSDMRFVRVNPSFARFLGFRPQELIGRTVRDVTHPEDVPMTDELIRKNSDRDASFTYEHRYTRRDGSVVWGRVTVTRLRQQDGALDGFLGVVEDITDSKRSEEALKRQSELLQSILSHLPVMVSVYDADGRPLFVNRKWEQVFGWMFEDVKTLQVLEQLYPEPEQRQRASDWIDKATGEWATFEATSRDGRKVACSWACVTLSNGTSVHIGEDVSERQQLQQRLLQAQKMEALGQLAGGVAHDFNNLLTVISACATFVLEEVGAKSKAAGDVREIIAAGNRAAALTRQLLAFSRRQMLRPEVVNVNEAIQTMAKTLGRLIGEHIQLAVVPAATAATVEVDVHQLEQVVLNLIVNARDAIQDAGTITVKTSDCPRASDDPGGRDYLVISVTDDGTGMEPAVLNRIFEPFFTTKPVGRGTGLGLATVHGIIEQSQGRIEVDSVVGVGTEFRVFLPVSDACDVFTADPVDIDQHRGVETVLLVEDEAALRAVARRILTDLGYTVLEARHGADAARLSAQHTGPIDLLVTDVVMPEMGGRELARHMRRQRPGIPVLYVSGYTDDELLRKGILEADAQLLRKPFMPADLARAVRELLRARCLAA